jgi:hypothetical protein
MKNNFNNPFSLIMLILIALGDSLYSQQISLSKEEKKTGSNTDSCIPENSPEKKTYSLEPRKNLEYYQEELFYHLYNKINKEHLSRYRISDFTSRKSNTLNFFEAAAFLLFAMTDKKYNKHIIWALERLYVLSGDAKLSELLLWNLANTYESYEKYKAASELYNQFKKIFPGSSFYWLSRYKEITVSYKYSQNEYHDISENEKIIELIKEYIIDNNHFNEVFFQEIMVILHDLSFKIIKKNLDTGLHYLKKYSYTHNNHTILSAWLRLYTLFDYIEFYQELSLTYDGGKENEKNKIYYATLLEIKRIVMDYFQMHDLIPPKGLQYEKEHDEIMKYISQNKSTLLNDIKNIFKKAHYAIESYYELA